MSDTMRAIVLTATGGPEALTTTETPVPSPGPAELLVKIAAAGVNFIDTYHRSGLYNVALPFTPGVEGAGTVAAIGTEVTTHAVGDRVAWAGPAGTYAEYSCVPAAKAVAVPPEVDFDLAAATMLQGMTAHYLVNDTHPLSSGDRCLIHAGAGGTGAILIQLAKAKGAEVFATVGTAEKARVAEAAGADHVILYQEVDFADAITEIAGTRPLDVVYDGVGKATFDGGMALLRPMGTMATFGNASGAVEPVSPLALAPSLFLTRPTLFDYIATREALVARAGSLFSDIAAGRLTIRVGHEFPLADARKAHEAIESRATTGKLLLHP